MGPATRVIRIIFSAIFGAIAAFIVCMAGGEFLYHALLQPRGLTDLAAPIVSAMVVLGAVVGVVFGARRNKITYHDDS